MSTAMLRQISRAELDEAYKTGSAGLFGAALFENPGLDATPALIDDDSIPRELHALACAMFLTIDSMQDGAPALIERFGHKRGFLRGVEQLGWLELTAKLTKFIALMEPYTDDASWWARFEAMEDGGSFEPFQQWFGEQELELDHRVSEFVRRNESAIFVVVEHLFSYGTLQQENVQRAQFGRLLEGAPDALVGFKQELVEITDPAVLAKSGKRFHPIVTQDSEAVDRIAGTVFRITLDELAAADAYEVKDYVRVETTLASGLKAWVYVLRS